MKAANLPHGLDLGNGRSLRFVQNHRDGDCVGAIETHPAARDATWGDAGQYHIEAGEPCEGSISFAVPEADLTNTRPRWTVESWEPLTLSPSLRCRICGNHGFIKSGAWLPA